MKTIISLLALSLAMAGCSNKTQEQVKSLDSVTHMPPDMHSSDKHIKIDPDLLAAKTDLSCGMSIRNSVSDTMTYHGKLYGFCGTGCKDDFAKDPHKYLDK